MTTQFITNQEKLLSEVINNILPSAQRLDILVGYFYFSGFQEIYQNLADKEIKILVGLKIEKNLSDKIREYEIIRANNLSRGKIRENYYQSLVELFNNTDYFNTREKLMGSF